MAEVSELRIVVLAAYPALRAGLRAMLDGLDGVQVIGELSTDAAGLDSLAADVLVADLGDDAARVYNLLDEIAGGIPVVLLGGADEYEGESGRPGAYLLRQAGGEEIVAAARAVARGLIVLDPAVVSAAGISEAGEQMDTLAGPLTDRELDVLRLIAGGLPNKAIALRLGISEHTVKFHVGAILTRLGAASRSEAVMLAARRGLLPL